MAKQELEKRYKKWCQDAAEGKVTLDHSDGPPITVGPLFRNVPTTPLVLRSGQDNPLPMLPLTTILRDTAQRIDKNAASLVAGNRPPPGEEMLVLTLQDLAAALANLGAYTDSKKGLQCLGLHLLPHTVGKWVSEVRLPEEMQVLIPTKDRLLSVIDKILSTDRFRYVAVHKSYAGLSRRDTKRMNRAQQLLQFKEPKAPLMGVLGDDLDEINLKDLGDPNVLGVYLCRKSMVQRIQENAERALQSFGLFTPEGPLDHVLANRLYEASRVYGNKIRYPIQRFAGTSGAGPIVREIPGLVPRAKDIIREHNGMMQVTSLLVRLVEKMLRVEGHRDGSKERGMLSNLRHATAAKVSDELMFFLNITQKDGTDNQQTFAPPLLSDFDLQEDSSGDTKPAWAKSLLELERLTGHDTVQDMRGSYIVTMAGFPFQCKFVLENRPGEPFYYCPNRFANTQDAIEHVKAVHQGAGFTDEIVMKIAQVDDQLADTAFGKLMQPINEVSKIHELELDEKNAEVLRRRPTLHADLHEMARIFAQNTRLLERLESDRDAAIRMLQSMDRSTEDGAETVKRQRQLFAARNREITEVRKHMLTPERLISYQETWNRAKARKAYVTKNMYKEFTSATDQCLWLERTLGEEARQYNEKVKAMGGVDPGAIPAGIPGGGIRVNKSNIGGMIAQDLIEQSRHLEAIQDANQALIATNREACFERVVSKTDVDFGASNVLPAAIPVLAADGWEDEVLDESNEQELESTSSELELQSTPELEPTPVSESKPSVIPPSNPLKRSRSEDDGDEEKPVPAVVVRGRSIPEELPEKVQVVPPSLQPFLQGVLDVELSRIFRICGLNEKEQDDALEKAKETLNLAFDPCIRHKVESLAPKDALSPGEIRTLMDPFRDKVSILVLTDPRLIRHPNGVLIQKLSGCVALIDSVHRAFPNNDRQLCSVLAMGICTLLQPKFQLSEAGLDIVKEALKCVLLERVEDGRDGHWEVVTKLVEALNGNLQGFWNAVYLRRYHEIRDPSHETRHVDKDPEKTYAPPNQKPSVDSVITRIKRPIIADTSVLSVSASDSSTVFSKLRTEEVQNLTKQVSSAVSGRDTDLVTIVDSEGLDAKTWIDRLVRGNVNATENPHVMCTWFRDEKASAPECVDEEKHQWLRQAYCCICGELLGSAPFQGWSCISGAKTLDSVLDRALRDESDSTRYTARRDTLKQSLVNKIISQPHYPSFHFWHRHCKQAEDNRRIIENHTRAMRGTGQVHDLKFDECPMCRTEYPREKANLPSMWKLLRKMEKTAKFVKRVVVYNALPEPSETTTNQSLSSALVPVARQEPPNTPQIIDVTDSDDESDSTNDATEPDKSDSDTPSEGVQLQEVRRTGVVYVGALFQKDTGCEASPAAMIPPSPAILPPRHNLTLYDEMATPSDNPDEEITELEQAVESIRPANAVADIGTQNPLGISQINALMDDLRPLHEFAVVLERSTSDLPVTPEMEAMIRSMLSMEDNPLVDNIEASALDRETGEDDDCTITNVVSEALEPVAHDSSVSNFGATVMGGSGSCGRRGCTACPLLMPRSNHIGTRRLSPPVDCQTRKVIYASICDSCQSLHGIGQAEGSMKEEIALLQKMSGNRRTLLTRCSLNHVPTFVGLDTFTTKEDALAKSKTWEDELRQMKTMKFHVI